ncbi:hypothetical protein T4A_221 [Trichinella pseudospiralis]|uniref:Uncharacterized protein n=1 Tax=Trichinella pseudospiralis TaxID=6337 RepID=A0A0V1EES6_TRIPS|nr:hypothetical protein T4A_221 [Trichinella pseudospiralis]
MYFKRKLLRLLGSICFVLQANQSQLKPEQLLLFKTISKNVSQMRICLKTNCPARRMPQHCIMHFNQLNLKLFHFNRSYMVAEDWTRNVDKIKARTNSLSIKLIKFCQQFHKQCYYEQSSIRFSRSQ